MGRSGKIKIILLIIGLIAAISAVSYINRSFIISKAIEKTFLRAGKPLKFGDYTVIINKIEGNNLSGVRITGDNKILEAVSGNYKYLPDINSIEVSLIDGTIELNDSNSALKNKLTFKKYHMIFKIK